MSSKFIIKGDEADINGQTVANVSQIGATGIQGQTGIGVQGVTGLSGGGSSANPGGISNSIQTNSGAESFSGDSHFLYDGSQATFNLVDNWGGLHIQGRSGGEASISLAPDNVGNGDTGMWVLGTNGSNLANPNDFAFYNAGTGGQPIVFQQATDNVGIGTNNPVNSLTIEQSEPASPSTPSSYAFSVSNAGTPVVAVGADGSNGYIQSFNSQPLFINPIGNNIILNSEGNAYVGIGTESPTAPLTVENSQDFDPSSNLSAAIKTTGPTSGGAIVLQDVETAGGIWMSNNGATLNLGAGGTSSGFSTNPSMSIDASGDVTVAGQIHNVTDPTSPQDAATQNYVGNNTSAVLVFNQPLNFGTFTSPELSFNAGTFTSPGQNFDAGTFFGSPDGTANANQFFINQSAGEVWNYSGEWVDVLESTAPVWILNGSIAYYDAGSVGIGTDAPTNLFTVQQSENSTYSDVTTYGIVLSNGSGTNNQIVSMGADTHGGLVQSWQGMPLLLNPAGNNVGINTESPAYALDVNGFIHSTDNINADANVTANQGVYGQTFNINNGGGSPNIINTNPGVGVILQGFDGAGHGGQLRIVANGGGWSDSQEATYFQIKNSVNNMATFMGGTYGADAPLDRLQFCSAKSTITNFSWQSTPAPTHVLEVLNATGGVPLLEIADYSGAPGNYIEVNSQFHSGGNVFLVDNSGNLSVLGGASIGGSIVAGGLISANAGLALGNGGSRQTLWLAGSGDFNHAFYNNESQASGYDFSTIPGNGNSNNDGEVIDYESFLLFQNRVGSSAISYFDTGGNLYVSNKLTVQTPQFAEDHSSFNFTGSGLNDASDGLTSYTGSYPQTITFTIAATSVVDIHTNAGGVGPNPGIGDTISDTSSGATGTVVYTNYGSGYFSITVSSGTFNNGDNLTDTTNGWVGSINSTAGGGDVVSISSSPFISFGTPVQIPVGGAGIGIGEGIQINWASGVGHHTGDYWTLQFYQTQYTDLGLTVDSANRNYALGDISVAGNGTLISIDDSTSMVNVHGTLNMNSNTVVNVSDPVNPQDALTLNYFNNHIAATLQVTHTLSPSDLAGLNTYPGYQIVDASSLTSNQAIVVTALEFHLNFNTTPYTTTANFFVNYGGNWTGGQLFPTFNTTNNSNIGLLTAGRTLYRYLQNSGTDFNIPFGSGAPALLMSDNTITGGDSNLIVRVTYQIITLP